ncbi:MEKHLA domain-containing protein [Salmonella enterica]|nr:MEKHLA domain-containing protein [Salmonella enterica]
MQNPTFYLLNLIDSSLLVHSGALLPVPPYVDNRYQWLHTQAPYGLLAHDNSGDPKFMYANQQALHCFKYTEEEITGLPSRFSAAEADRDARQELLLAVREKGITGNYTGPRVNKFGQSFTIHGGIVWHIYNDKKGIVGQAALFWPNDFNRPDWFNIDI